jgi:hydroxyacylglutathione hydrolase
VSYTIKTITLDFVNCYLIRLDDGFILIDTGVSSKLPLLEKVLQEEGCNADNFKLILLTHGDSDHVGNCVYLRKKYNTKIAMHKSDSEIVETGDMTLNRKEKPDRYTLFFRIISFFGREDKFETFTPDIYFDDGDSLREYGFNADVIHIPGHSKGSIGILTEEGDFFCGDLINNIFGRPKLHFLIDDLTEARNSIEKMKSLGVKKVYPGHGKAFSRLDKI